MSLVTLLNLVYFKTCTWRLYHLNPWISVDHQRWRQLRHRFQFSGMCLLQMEVHKSLLTLFTGMVDPSEEANQETCSQLLNRWLHSTWSVDLLEVPHISLLYLLQTTLVKVQTQLLLDFKQHKHPDFHLPLLDYQLTRLQVFWLAGQLRLTTVVLHRLLTIRFGLTTASELAIHLL